MTCGDMIPDPMLEAISRDLARIRMEMVCEFALKGKSLWWAMIETQYYILLNELQNTLWNRAKEIGLR